MIFYCDEIYFFNHCQVYSLLALSTFTVLCNHHHSLSQELFHHPKLELSYPLNKHFLSIHPLMDIWVFPAFCLLWIMLLGPSEYKYVLSPCFLLFWYTPRNGDDGSDLMVISDFKECCSVAFSTFMMLCHHRHCITQNSFIIPPKNSYPLSRPPLFLATTNLLSVSMDLPIVDISCE